MKLDNILRSELENNNYNREDAVDAVTDILFNDTQWMADQGRKLVNQYVNQRMGSVMAASRTSARRLSYEANSQPATVAKVAPSPTTSTSPEKSKAKPVQDWKAQQAAHFERQARRFERAGEALMKMVIAVANVPLAEATRDDLSKAIDHYTKREETSTRERIFLQAVSDAIPANTKVGKVLTGDDLVRLRGSEEMDEAA